MGLGLGTCNCFAITRMLSWQEKGAREAERVREAMPPRRLESWASEEGGRLGLRGGWELGLRFTLTVRVTMTVRVTIRIG